MLKLAPRETAHSLAVSVTEACRLSGFGRTTFYKLLKSGKVTAHKCGRRTVVLLDEFEQELRCLPRVRSAS